MDIDQIQIGNEYYVNTPNAKGTWRAHSISKDKNENTIVTVKRVTTRQHLRGSDTRTVNPSQLILKKESKMSGLDIELGEQIGEIAPGMPIYKTVIHNLPNPRGRRQGFKR